MLDNDIFVRHRVCDAGSIKEIAGLINKAFSGCAEKAEDIVLILAAYCVYISYEEIYNTFPLNSANVQNQAIPSLIKKGLLEKFSVSPRGVARTFFRITEAGFAEANALCYGRIPNKYPKKKKLNNTSIQDAYMDHIYFSGYNLFSVLAMGLPFAWRREYPYTYGRGYSGPRSKGDLIVDARCSFFPEDASKYRLAYIEQDMGTEHMDVLLSKLHKYYKYHLMDRERDMIVFSFVKKNVCAPVRLTNPDEYVYSTTRCKELLYYMEENDIRDAVDIVKNEDVDQLYLKAIMLLTGAAKVSHGVGVRGDFVLDASAVREFYNSLVFRRNPYQHRDFNLKHASFAFNRMADMGAYLLTQLRSLPLFAREMAAGFPVYCMPTTLVSDRLPFGMLDEFPELQKKLITSFSSYFKDIVFRGELSERITLSDNGFFIKPRNAFYYSYGNGKKGLIAAEFLSFDLGAWIRAFLFVNHMRNAQDNNVRTAQDRPVQLICIFDTVAHKNRFLEMFNVFPDQPGISGERSGVYCLMMKDVGRPDRVFIPANGRDKE